MDEQESVTFATGDEVQDSKKPHIHGHVVGLGQGRSPDGRVWGSHYLVTRPNKMWTGILKENAVRVEEKH